MMKKSTAYLDKLLLLLFTVTVFLDSCKKDNDVVTTQNIRGQVYNACTDSGLANITVYLNVVNSGSGSTSLKAVSDGTGNFTFANVQVHSNSSYIYNLFIPSKSGIGNGPEIGFDGIDADINKDHISEVLKCYVAPHFQIWNLYFPSTKQVTVNDTFTLTIQQNTLHKNMPGATYKTITHFPPPPLPQYPANWISALDNYYMGWWQVTIDKTINGTHIVTNDSVYVSWTTGTQTDTIPW